MLTALHEQGFKMVLVYPKQLDIAKKLLTNASINEKLKVVLSKLAMILPCSKTMDVRKIITETLNITIDRLVVWTRSGECSIPAYFYGGASRVIICMMSWRSSLASYTLLWGISRWRKTSVENRVLIGSRILDHSGVPS